MSLEWRKILESAEKVLYSVSQKPKYERAKPSVEEAVSSMKKAMKRIEAAEKGNVIEGWYSGKTSFLTGGSYSLAKTLVETFKVDRIFTADHFDMIGEGAFGQYVKFDYLGPDSERNRVDRNDLHKKLRHLITKGFLAKRRIISENNLEEIEYKITKEGEGILTRQEKMKKKTRTTT